MSLTQSISSSFFLSPDIAWLWMALEMVILLALILSVAGFVTEWRKPQGDDSDPWGY